MELKELKIVNLERLRTRRNDKECEKNIWKSVVLKNTRIEFSDSFGSSKNVISPPHIQNKVYDT